MGSVEVDEEAMNEFNCLLEDLDVTEHPAAGCYYSWCNLRGNEDRIYSKIDRCFYE